MARMGQEGATRSSPGTRTRPLPAVYDCWPRVLLPGRWQGSVLWTHSSSDQLMHMTCDISGKAFLYPFRLRGQRQGRVAAVTCGCCSFVYAPGRRTISMQATRSNVQVENSQHEAETDSTASSPQPPLPRGRGHSALPQPIDEPSTNKVRKPVKIKRRTSSRTTSDVWEYFTQEDTEDGPVAVCGFCDQVYQCDRSYHGTSTLRSHR